MTYGHLFYELIPKPGQERQYKFPGSGDSIEKGKSPRLQAFGK